MFASQVVSNRHMKNIDSQKHDHGYLILATDDILLATNSTKATMLLEKK